MALSDTHDYAGKDPELSRIIARMKRDLNHC